MANYLCIDAGFTLTRFAVVTPQGMGPISQLRTIDLHSSPSLPPDRKRALWLSWLAQVIADQCPASGTIERIGLSLPGPVEADGAIAAANSLWGQASRPLLAADLSAALGHPTIARNDIFAASTYYGTEAAEDDHDTTFILSVGSGIGSKLYDRRSGGVVSGRRGLDGEIGFSVVETGEGAARTLDGTMVGTLGLYASGSGFARMVRAEAERQPHAFFDSRLATLLDEAGFDVQSADRFDVNAAAIAAIASGDPFTGQILRQSVAYLARALHIVILFAAPDRVVLTGGFALAIGASYRELLIDQLEGQLRPLHSRRAIEDMITLGRADGTENLRGMAIHLSALDEQR